MTRLATTTWPQVDRRDRELLVLPIGSLEQHGPHLPLDTDARIATEVASRLVAARPAAES
jgi:mycofactocin precursor peptide peptidase